MGKRWTVVENHWSKQPNREDILERIRQSKRGVLLSDEHKNKIGDALRGKPKHWINHPGNGLKGNGAYHPCKGCGKLFQYGINMSKRSYCADECRRKYSVPAFKGKPRFHMRGEKHRCWKGGITEKNHIIRTSLEMKIWRRQVFRRDNYTCQICKVHGGTLHADHIRPFSLYPELRFDIDNGRTLCPPCHLKHGWRPYQLNINIAVTVT